MTMTTEALDHVDHVETSTGQHLLYHFDDLDQQHLSSMLGMWAFLATEVMFFGGLILAFIVYRSYYHPAFAAAASWLNVALGGINTAILLISSLTMALAVHYSQLRRPGLVVRYLLLTMLFGTGFLVVKGFEWTADYEENLIPFINFRFEGPKGHHTTPEAQAFGREIKELRPKEYVGSSNEETREDQPPPGVVNPGDEQEYPIAIRHAPGNITHADVKDKAEMFFVLYFFMTGLHALHLIIGIGLVGVITFLVWRGWFSGTGQTQIEVTGLYWHFIDIVWVFLYPLLYLIDLNHV